MCKLIERSNMLTVNLSKQDVMALVKSSYPNEHNITNIIIYKYGMFNSGHVWKWNVAELYKLPIVQLYDLYVMCKKSWHLQKQNERL